MEWSILNCAFVCIGVIPGVRPSLVWVGNPGMCPEYPLMATRTASNYRWI